MPSSAVSLPVLMYHYISRYQNPISVSPELFELHCKSLAEAGWRGVSLAEAEAYFLRGEKLPARSCLITFDDGYLDNYVYAWPLLEKYGHKGVLFAVASRIGAEKDVRPTLREVWNKKIGKADLPRVDQPFVPHPLGYEVREDLFFTWEEARIMEASGVMSVASHSMRHHSVFTGPEYSGFLMPGRRKRTFDRTRFACWGVPLFPQRPGLSHRGFIPSDELLAAIHELVPQDEEAAFHFFAAEDNKKRLQDLAASFAKNMGRMETDGEMRARMREELASGKALMERELGHEVTTLCWPWGAYNELSLNLGRELGFKAFLTTREGPNPPCSPLGIRRFKAKAKGGSWLLSRVWLYSRPVLGSLYAKLRM